MFSLISVSKTFNPKTTNPIPVFSNVSLTVNERDIFGLIGPSGTGKSTLLRIFNLLETPDTGQVRIQNKTLTKQNSAELRLARQKIGMIFQNFNLLSNKTVEQNIALPLEIAGQTRQQIAKRIEECLDVVNLKDKRGSYPNQLSGGQKQRVGIARAIANKPSLLLADEPTSALDPMTKHEILTCLQDINRKLGVTIIIATHEMAIVKRICNRVAILGQGQILETLSLEDGRLTPTSDLGKKLLEFA